MSVYTQYIAPPFGDNMDPMTVTIHGVADAPNRDDLVYVNGQGFKVDHVVRHTRTVAGESTLAVEVYLRYLFAREGAR